MSDFVKDYLAAMRSLDAAINELLAERRRFADELEACLKRKAERQEGT